MHFLAIRGRLEVQKGGESLKVNYPLRLRALTIDTPT